MGDCHVCGRGLRDVPSLFRVNSKGIPGIWACWEHLNAEQRVRVDPHVKEIVRVISDVPTLNDTNKEQK